MNPPPTLSARPRLLLLAALVAAVFTVASADGLVPRAAAQEGEAPEKAAAPAEIEASPWRVFKHTIYAIRYWAPILGLCSIAIVTLVVLLALELRMGAAVPASFVEDFTDTVNKRRFKEAYEIAKEDGSFVGRVLTTGMSRLQYGIEDAREAAYNMVDSIKAGKEQLVTYLATIGTLGPMLGLVGTVWGMILSFMRLGSSDKVDAQGLAGDISHALVITLLGIGLSVPAIFCHAFFRNRLIKLAHDTGNVADDLLTQMYHNSKKAPGPSGTVDVAPVADVRPVPTAGVKPK